MNLSLRQIEEVRQYVRHSGVTDLLLEDDLVDHLCCEIENRVSVGQDFETALREAARELAPDGLADLQEKTIFLLNSKKIILMKKVTFLIGALSAMSLVLGWTFAVLHWLGARELFLGGLFGFVFVFLPLLIIDRYKRKIRWMLSDKIKYITGFVSCVTMSVGAIFKVMHLPGADQLLLIGTLLMTLGFVPFLFFTMYRKSLS